MDFDSSKAVELVLATVRDAADVGAGMKSLVDDCRLAAPRRTTLWGMIDRIDFAADAASLAAALRRRLENDPIPPQFNGFYFGLDGLNMRRKKGVEWGCSESFNGDAADNRWPYDCSLYPQEIPSPALVRLYASGVELASREDYTICLGYLGLALRDALRSIPAQTFLGGAPHRAIVFGFHNGDLLTLGVVRPGGLELFAQPPKFDEMLLAPKALPGTRLDRILELRDRFRASAWMLQKPFDRPYAPYLAMIQAKRFSDSPPPLIVSQPGERDDITLPPLLFGLPILNARAALWAGQQWGEQVQLVPCGIDGVVEQHYYLNVLNVVDCVDRARSVFSYNRKGQVSGILPFSNLRAGRVPNPRPYGNLPVRPSCGGFAGEWA